MTLIVLGESLVGVINGISEMKRLSIGSIVDGSLGIFVSIGLWWVYFDFIAHRAARASIYTALLWVYLHLFLMTCITMTGVGIFTAIRDIEQGTLTQNSRLLLTFGSALSIISMGGLEMTLHRRTNEPTHPVISPLFKFGGGVMVLVAGLSMEDIGISSLLLIILLSLAVQQVYGVTTWFAQGSESASEVR